MLPIELSLAEELGFNGLDSVSFSLKSVRIKGLDSWDGLLLLRALSALTTENELSMGELSLELECSLIMSGVSSNKTINTEWTAETDILRLTGGLSDLSLSSDLLLSVAASLPSTTVYSMTQASPACLYSQVDQLRLDTLFLNASLSTASASASPPPPPPPGANGIFTPLAQGGIEVLNAALSLLSQDYSPWLSLLLASGVAGPLRQGLNERFHEVLAPYALPQDTPSSPDQPSKDSAYFCPAMQSDASSGSQDAHIDFASVAALQTFDAALKAGQDLLSGIIGCMSEVCKRP